MKKKRRKNNGCMETLLYTHQIKSNQIKSNKIKSLQSQSLQSQSQSMQYSTAII
jgi:hypothetical protein